MVAPVITAAFGCATVSHSVTPAPASKATIRPAAANTLDRPPPNACPLLTGSAYSRAQKRVKAQGDRGCVASDCEKKFPCARPSGSVYAKYRVAAVREGRRWLV